MTANYDERAKALGRYMAESGATVRVAARAFGMAKSTVHKDVTERLPMLDAALAERVREVLEKNLAERPRAGSTPRSRPSAGISELIIAYMSKGLKKRSESCIILRK